MPSALWPLSFIILLLCGWGALGAERLRSHSLQRERGGERFPCWSHRLSTCGGGGGGGGGSNGGLVPGSMSGQKELLVAESQEVEELRRGKSLCLRGGGDKEEEEQEEQEQEVEEEGEEEVASAMSKMKVRGEGSSGPNVNVVLIGHVDSGKSTISGHILYDTGGLDQRTLDKYEKDAKAIGRESWKYAWAMDTTEEERAKGKTQECGRATCSTDKRHYTLLDAPGHKNYVPFMIGGASQAEVAILVISARTGEFEAGYERGGQTREHAVLAKTAGINTLLVAVNKMDECKWSKERFDEIVGKLEPYLKASGFDTKKDVTWVPMEGLSGANLKDRLAKGACEWYQDGPSLLEALDNVVIAERNREAPLRMMVADKYREADIFVMGKILQGTVKKGQSILCQPKGTAVSVAAIAIDGEELEEAVAGDNVRLRIRHPEDDIIEQGSVLCEESSPCHAITEFEAKINVLACKTILSGGFQCMLHLHNALVECTWEKVVSVKDKKLGDVKMPFVKVGQQAVVRVSVQQPVCAELFANLGQLGRFVMREEGQTVAVGVVTRLGPADGSD